MHVRFLCLIALAVLSGITAAIAQPVAKTEGQALVETTQGYRTIPDGKTVLVLGTVPEDSGALKMRIRVPLASGDSSDAVAFRRGFWISAEAKEMLRASDVILERAAAEVAAQRQKEEQEQTERALRTMPPVVVYRAIADAEYVGSELDIRFGFHDPGRTVKYVRATVVPYNRVGDRITGSFGKSSAKLVATGPFEASVDPTSLEWENVWFDVSDLSCVRVTRLEIEYMSGPKRIFVRDLPQVFDEWRNSCTVEAQAENEATYMRQLTSY